MRSNDRRPARAAAAGSLSLSTSARHDRCHPISAAPLASRFDFAAARCGMACALRRAWMAAWRLRRRDRGCSLAFDERRLADPMGGEAMMGAAELLAKHGIKLDS